MLLGIKHPVSENNGFDCKLFVFFLQANFTMPCSQRAECFWCYVLYVCSHASICICWSHRSVCPQGPHHQIVHPPPVMMSRGPHAHSHTLGRTKRVYHVRDCLSSCPVSMSFLEKGSKMKVSVFFIFQERTDNLQCKGGLYHWVLQIKSRSGSDYIDRRKGFSPPSVCRPSRGDLLPMCHTKRAGIWIKMFYEEDVK